MTIFSVAGECWISFSIKNYDMHLAILFIIGTHLKYMHRHICTCIYVLTYTHMYVEACTHFKIMICENFKGIKWVYFNIIEQFILLIYTGNIFSSELSAIVTRRRYACLFTSHILKAGWHGFTGCAELCVGLAKKERLILKIHSLTEKITDL